MTPLTRRQSQVCDLLVNGDRNKDIAEKLGISPRTVEEHRADVFRKCGVSNVAQLINKVRNWNDDDSASQGAVLGGRTDGFQDGAHSTQGD